MRIILTTIVALFIVDRAFGQETKKMTFQNENPNTKEVFYVLKENTNIKHGEYKRTFLGHSGFKEQGQYENNAKVGVWEYYDSKGEVEQKVDYSNNKVIFSKPFPQLIKSFILEGEISKENNSGESPLLLGGQTKFLYYMMRYIRYPAEARRMGTQGTILVLFQFND